MTVGSIVHELFQIVLHRKLSALSQIRTACEELLNSRNVAFQLYASEMTAKEAWTELENFIEKIFDFVEEYVNGKKIANRKVGSTNLVFKLKKIGSYFLFFWSSLIIKDSMVKSTAFKTSKRISGYQS